MKRLVLLGLIVLFLACPSAPKNSAKIYIERQEYERAKEQILIGIKESPDDYELYCLLLKAEIGLSNWIEASTAFHEGVKVDSANAFEWLFKDEKNISVYQQGFYNAAFSQFSDKKYNEALGNLRYASLIDPNDESVYILMGAIYSEINDEDNANKAYAKALSINPKNPEAHYRIGNSLFKDKKYDEALTKLNDAIKYFEKQHTNIAKVIFANLPEVDKALAQKIIKLWLDKKPGELDELIKVKLGYDAGLNAMRNSIDKFYKTSDGLARSYYLAGMCHYNLKDTENALAKILKSLALIPDDLDALYFAGELNIRAGEYQKAIEHFNKITMLKDDDLYAWFYIAVAKTQLKKYKEAIDIYEGKVLVLDPKNIDAMTNLAFCYREIGNNKKALEYLMKAEKLQKEQ